MFFRTKPAYIGLLLSIMGLFFAIHGAVPNSGFVTYSKGDKHNRTLIRRVVSSGQMQSEEKICNKGSAGGDIQGVISHDGKFLAFSRSDGSAGSNDDYHKWKAWDVHIVSLEGSLPATPTLVAQEGYFPCWGDDSHNATKTLYWSSYEGRKVWKATVDASGNVSGITTHYSVPTGEYDFHCQVSPDGKKVAYRENGTVYIRHFAGSLNGSKFNAGAGCHPSWLANSRWLIHANRKICRDDGQHYDNWFGEAGDYHYGTSQDLNWFITRSGGDYTNQNDGDIVHIMPLIVTDNSFTADANQKTQVTNDGSWVDVHVGDMAPPQVAISEFWAAPSSVTPGASTTLKWTVSNATSLAIDGETVTGTSKSVSPSSTTTYELVAQGEGGPVSKQVTVNVSQPELTSIELDPEVATVNLGETLTITATPKDQVGNDFSADITWSKNGIGSLSTTSGTQTVFTAPTDNVGPATIKATSGSIEASILVMVVDPNALLIQVNCGGAATGTWENDEAYVVSGNAGTAFDFGQGSDLSGVDNPAPADVYKTVRHGDHAYLFSAVGDGSYTVRIHFTDHYGGNRKMNYTIEGQQVLTDFSITDAAGGTGKAVVKEFDITVSDGNGLSIVCTMGSGNDVFESGIEIIGQGSTLAPKTIKIDASVAEQNYAPGDEMTITWKAGAEVSSVMIELFVEATLATYTLTTESSIARTSDQWGAFAWTVPEEIDGDPIAGDVRIVIVDYGDNSNKTESSTFTIGDTDVTRRHSAGLSRMNKRLMIRHTPRGYSIAVRSDTFHTVEIFSLDGRKILARNGSGAKTYSAPVSKGMYLLRFEYDGQTSTHMLRSN